MRSRLQFSSLRHRALCVVCVPMRQEHDWRFRILTQTSKQPGYKRQTTSSIKIGRTNTSPENKRSAYVYSYSGPHEYDQSGIYFKTLRTIPRLVQVVPLHGLLSPPRGIWFKLSRWLGGMLESTKWWSVPESTSPISPRYFREHKMKRAGFTKFHKVPWFESEGSWALSGCHS